MEPAIYLILGLIWFIGFILMLKFSPRGSYGAVLLDAMFWPLSLAGQLLNKVD